MYDDDCDERIPYTLLAERTQRARRDYPCSHSCRSGIPAGEVHLYRVALVDGEFNTERVCLWCESGQPRPGTPEYEAEVATYARVAAEEEADFRADQAFYGDYLRRFPSVEVADDPDLWRYCAACFSGRP